MKTLLIRTDANQHIGIGHLMRCLALAQSWKYAGGRVTFISNLDNPKLHAKILAEGFQIYHVEKVHPAPSDFATTARVAKEISIANNTSWIVIDGYHFNTDFQKSLRNIGIKVLVIDDYNHLHEYCAHIILNQNVNAESISYKNACPVLPLLGRQYILLRDEFLNLRSHTYHSRAVRKLLITMGGSDPENITTRIIAAISSQQFKGIEKNLVIGPTNSNAQNIKTIINRLNANQKESSGNFILHSNADMPALLSKADLAISAGGSTCWELCYLGIPFLVIVAAENQIGIARELDQRGVAKSLGWYKDISEKDIRSNLQPLIADSLLRNKLSASAAGLIDGKGRDRVVRNMLSFESS